MIKIIKKEDLNTNEWSGGTTTQLYIYPENSSYKERNFLFRVSTATVDIEESHFTKLPGISRCIMPLNGEMILSHKGHHNISLKEYEIDSFEGDWDTISKGKVKDFNLMTNKGTEGSLDSCILYAKDEYSTERLDKESVATIYIQKGEIKIEVNNEKILLSEGDFVIFHKEGDKPSDNIIITSDKYAEIALAYIKNIH